MNTDDDDFSDLADDLAEPNPFDDDPPAHADVDVVGADLADEETEDDGAEDEPEVESAAPEPAPENEKIEPRYRNADEFVEHFLRNAVERRVNTANNSSLRWDPRWRRHPEVVLRLDALWKAFEGAVASTDPGAMSKWWIYDFDPHMRVILEGESGPMSNEHDQDIHPPLPMVKATPPAPEKNRQWVSANTT